MVEIGGFPIIWHIMKSYAHYGFNDFIAALGYKSIVNLRLSSEAGAALDASEAAASAPRSSVTTSPTTSCTRRS